MAQTWPTTTTSTDDIKDGLVNNETRSDACRSQFSGTSRATSPVVGQPGMFLDGSTSGYDIHEAYYDPEGSGDAWYEVGSIQHGNLTAVDGSHQLVNWRVENTASPLAAAAGTVGWVGVDTSGGTNRLTVNRDASTQDIVVHGNSTEFILTDLPLESWTDGATPPTTTVVGTTPAITTKLFDAIAETAMTRVYVPKGIDGASSPILRLWFALNIAETANDDINITVDMISVSPNPATDTLTKTSTSYTGTKDIGAVNGQYTVHEVDVTLTYNDATNPIAGGDWLFLEFHLTNLTTIGAVLFLGGQLLTPFGGTTLET